MKRGGFLPRRTSLPRSSGLFRSTPIPATSTKRAARAGDIPAAVRKAVRERSHGVCEGCTRGELAEHIHHRKLRSQGGRHDLVNLLHLSLACHEAAHLNRPRAEALGLIVRSSFDPADVPVRRLQRSEGDAA